MTVTARQAELIRQSFHTLRQRLEPASMSFYEALFRRAPELRSMFRDDLAGQGMKFITTLDSIIGNLESPEALGDRFADLGRGHALLGVKAAHFAPMGEALLETLRDELGEGFTPELESAWRTAYDALAARIIRRGEIR
ncbi:globin domain-containing protein [Defluviimonas sp. SAOS-178_SWC]|uniref:globin domain-containing protein n=1 Tax=Defluviimonas sp. SAOS-178_SWC TaxID=3121287 RepID=UPI003221C432